MIADALGNPLYFEFRGIEVGVIANLACGVEVFCNECRGGLGDFFAPGVCP